MGLFVNFGGRVAILQCRIKTHIGIGVTYNSFQADNVIAQATYSDRTVVCLFAALCIVAKRCKIGLQCVLKPNRKV